MKDRARYNVIQFLPRCPNSSKYTPHSILQHISDKCKTCVYHNDINVYLQYLYCNDEKRLRSYVFSKKPYIGHTQMKAPDKKRKHSDQSTTIATKAEKYDSFNIRHVEIPAPDTQSEALKLLIDLRIKI